MVMGVFVMFSPIFFFVMSIIFNVDCYYQFIAEVHFLLFLLFFGNLKFQNVNFDGPLNSIADLKVAN